MNKKQLMFISFFSSLIGFLVLFSFLPSGVLAPSQLKDKFGYVCVYGDLTIKCSGENSFGTICDKDCVNLVTFGRCVTNNIKNRTVCGRLNYYQNKMELIVMEGI